MSDYPIVRKLQAGWDNAGCSTCREAANLIEEMAAALEKIADPINCGPDGSWDAHSYPDEIARAGLKNLGGSDGRR